MKILKKYYDFISEKAPSIPKSEEVWRKRGKRGKEVMLYFHDDMDGVFSAIVMKGWLLRQGFTMAGYGIVNYQEGWTTTTIRPEYINIALDYAENVNGIDVYIDHHGEFVSDELFAGDVSITKGEPAIKTKTGSAYEGICIQLGIPTDNLILNVIDMIDSAKYEEYNVDVKTILRFDAKKFSNKLEFAGAFNQLLKRSDYKTFIEVVCNYKDPQPSIYRIFDLFKKLYPANNLDTIYLKKVASREFDIKIAVSRSTKEPDKIDMTVGEFVQWLLDNGHDDIFNTSQKDFVGDAAWRIDQMRQRTQGKEMSKQYIRNQDEFKAKFQETSKTGVSFIKLTGYQILGQMVFVPSGTWANALRARAIIEEDLDKNSRFLPTIRYEITEDSVDYEKYEEMNNQEVELIGDIDNRNAANYKFTIKRDVTETKELEGIKGIIKSNVGDKLIFEAKQPLFWILLQYGNTLQVCTFHKFEKYAQEYLPKLNGEPILDLSKYCNELLQKMNREYGYNNSATKSGGHPGIGSISNIFGTINPAIAKNVGENFENSRFLDLFKNHMIQDLSLIPWVDLTMPWGDKDEIKTTPPKEHGMDYKVMMVDQIRKIDIDQAL